MFDTPTRDRRAERREATKAEILEAAWEQCRAEGLASLSLRDLARRVGMQAPSLYSYFDSKTAIYDAMFAQGYRDFVAALPTHTDASDPRDALRRAAHFFVRFCVADSARYQLLFQRTIPGFEPSPESYAFAVEALATTTTWFTAHGFDARDLDLWTALVTGLTDQQISNDPGGTRWTRLIDDAMEMFLDHVHERASTKRGRKR
jgi:AcrR family transcriptional regulator